MKRFYHTREEKCGWRKNKKGWNTYKSYGEFYPAEFSPANDMTINDDNFDVANWIDDGGIYNGCAAADKVFKGNLHTAEKNLDLTFLRLQYEAHSMPFIVSSLQILFSN